MMNNVILYPEVIEVAKNFLNTNKILEIAEIKSGHINSTYMIKMPHSTYIIQQINTHVFVSPFGIMHNIKEVTNHIRKKVIYEGKDPNRSVLNIVKTMHNQKLVIYNDRYWRCMQYIDDATTYEVIKSKKMFYEVGKAVGEFQMLLDDFEPNILDETIPHFHDTPYRLQHFLDTVKLDKFNRVKDVLKEVDFFYERKQIMSLITNALAKGEIPKRVTHNDTKLSNVMIDNNTEEALCLIDLDTVMQGSLLYDYGDAIRIGASTAAEDEQDLSLVKIDIDLVESFTKGFLKEVKDIITNKEIDYLYYGCLIITLEIGMRFLDDYLDGDKYFKIDYDKHNLSRCRAQIKLAQEIENKKELIINVINKLLNEINYNYKIEGDVKYE